MKNKITIRVLLTLGICIITLSVVAQLNDHTTIEVSEIPKIVMVLFTSAGIFMGYLQLRLSIKLATLDAKFTASLRQEVENVETKLRLSLKELELKVATSKDIENIEKIQNLNFDLLVEKIKGLEKQLDLAAFTLKKAQ